MERGILRAVPSPQLVLDPLLPTGEFLSRLSHELRTPLNAVLGFAQLLELEGLEPQQTRQVGQILRGARHLLGLLNELLEISRIEAGTLRMALAPVPVAQLVREALASVERLGAERSVRFEADLDAHADLHVLADRQRLGQVVLSLLCNALGRSRDRGVVTIAAERHGDRVRLTVADNGATLGEEDLSRIFVPCERSAAAPAASGGSGLALALSRRYAELMRGSLSGTSRAGAGVALTLELALAAGLRLVADRTATLVLYVEDSDANYALAREMSRPSRRHRARAGRDRNAWSRARARAPSGRDPARPRPARHPGPRGAGPVAGRSAHGADARRRARRPGDAVAGPAPAAAWARAST